MTPRSLPVRPLPPAPAGWERWRGGERPGVWLLLLALAVAAAYAGSLRGAFVFDDLTSIVTNDSIRRLGDLGAVLTPPGETGQTVGGRPLLNLTFALNYAAGGTAPLGYHLVNLVVHWAVAALLFGLVRRSLRRAFAPEQVLHRHAAGVAGAAALLWAVHPLTTAAVTYVVQRAESLAALGWLAALYAFARSADSARPGRWQMAAVLASLAAMLTKETAAGLPLALLCYDRLFVAGAFAAAWRQRRGFYLALAATWLPLLGQLVLHGSRDHTVGYGVGVDPWHYLLTQAWALGHYAQLAVWPAGQVFDYGRQFAVTQLAAVWLQALAILAVLAAAVVGLWRGRAWAFPLVVAFLVLAPSSSFVPQRDPVFEHRFYLPLAALGVLLLGGAVRAGGARVLLVVPLLAMAAGWATGQRNLLYHDPVALWRDSVAAWPNSSRARLNLGVELTNRGRLEEARAELAAAVALAPADGLARHNLGNVLVLLRRPAEAIPHLETALRAEPGNYKARVALADARLATGELERAIADYQAAAVAAPQWAAPRTSLGRAGLRAGRLEEAIGHFAAAAELAPADAAVHFNLGDACVRAGHWAEAEQSFARCVALDAHHVGAWTNLGNLRLRRGELAAAEAAFRTALALQPGDLIETSLGVTLLRQRRTAEAVQAFQAAVRLNPDNRFAREALARLGAAP